MRRCLSVCVALALLPTGCVPPPSSHSDVATFSAVSTSTEVLPALSSRFERHLGPEFQAFSPSGPPGIDAYIATGNGRVCVGIIHDQVATSCNELNSPDQTFSILSVEVPGRTSLTLVAAPDGYTAGSIGALECRVESNTLMLLNANLSEELVLTGPGMRTWRFAGQVMADESATEGACFVSR